MLTDEAKGLRIFLSASAETCAPQQIGHHLVLHCKCCCQSSYGRSVKLRPLGGEVQASAVFYGNWIIVS